MIGKGNNMKLEDLSQLKQDMLLDIANGICGSQMVLDGNMLVDKKRNIKDYKPKTNIPKTINNLLTPVLEQIHKDGEWNNEDEFITRGEKIKLIYYSNDDWCKIQRNDNSIIKINKKYFRELYESREIL